MLFQIYEFIIHLFTLMNLLTKYIRLLIFTLSQTVYLCSQTDKAAACQQVVFRFETRKKSLKVQLIRPHFNWNLISTPFQIAQFYIIFTRDNLSIKSENQNL